MLQRPVTENSGVRSLMPPERLSLSERLAVDGTTLYGVSKTEVYQLENSTWKEVASEVPERVTSLAVDGNVLYVGTQGSGVLHFNLNE